VYPSNGFSLALEGAFGILSASKDFVLRVYSSPYELIHELKKSLLLGLLQCSIL